MTDMAARPAGGLRFTELPMADSRTEAYAMLREAGPVARGVRGGYMVVSGAAVEFVLKHPELFSSRQAFDGVGSPLPLVPIAFDPPEHARYRRVLQPFFSPRGVAAWQPMVRARAGELIDGFAGRGECDVVTELAVPLPAQVFLTLFGLPLEDRDRLIAWKEALLHNFDFQAGEPPSERAARVGAELWGYLVGHIGAQRERGGTDDLLGRLLADRGDERLSDDEILGLSFLFVLAGLETVTSALSTAFAALAAQPALRRQIAADPAVIPDAVEELLRFDGPVVFVPRIATRDVEVSGQLIPAGSYVMVTIAVASRDPAEHPDPDMIDFRRQERNLAFGGGPHRCLGSHLARMEMRMALEEWHRRIPEYELAPGVIPRVTWPAGVVGIDSLPLVFPR
ncbi:MAG TPA: cytochrome P450 [Streptosporangiaceae bacterium]|nr:cytochrome P450 [Streptosporangiaceae bacterium]